MPRRLGVGEDEDPTGVGGGDGPGVPVGGQELYPGAFRRQRAAERGDRARGSAIGEGDPRDQEIEELRRRILAGLPATEPVPVYPVEVRDGDLYVDLNPSNGVTPS